ncbi:ABC-2 type transport system permease protein [Paenibacillus turicensis]|uniref:ABC-2 type transport system permease protein n=1 Tax=Paenibacillus turicensis TaxID=160487 RepID=A0ABS4FR95_9BACL|nr:ABC-2 family transporter protein [Paenibacillus turicensis]MBP1904873.1 ABC-2 type transport system permease protein [Paenibacillus turicensis]
MALYIEFLKKAFRERYAFRFNFYITILASVMLLIIQINVWTALYGGNGNVSNINFGEMISYIIIASIVMTLTKSGSGQKIAERVENGSIILDLMKPVNFKRYIFSEDLGTNLFQTVFITIPSIAFTWLFFDFSLSGGFGNTLIFAITLILAILIAFHIHYIFGLFAFWLETSWYIPFFIGSLFQLFSGSVVPLWFYPNWLYKVCQILPFRFIFFEPIAIFLGKYEIHQMLSILLMQIGWLAFIICIEKYMWYKVQTKLVIHGG